MHDKISTPKHKKLKPHKPRWYVSNHIIKYDKTELGQLSGSFSSFVYLSERKKKMIIEEK